MFLDASSSGSLEAEFGSLDPGEEYRTPLTFLYAETPSSSVFTGRLGLEPWLLVELFHRLFITDLYRK
jgi:hypothetical protein